MGFWFVIFVLTLFELSRFVLHQCLHYEVVDLLFPRAQEFHIVDRTFPSGTPKNKILLSACYDSPYEFPLLSRLRMRPPLLILSTVAMVVITGFLGLLRYFYDVDAIQRPMLIVSACLLFVLAALRGPTRYSWLKRRSRWRWSCS